MVKGIVVSTFFITLCLCSIISYIKDIGFKKLELKDTIIFIFMLLLCVLMGILISFER